MPAFGGAAAAACGPPVAVNVEKSTPTASRAVNTTKPASTSRTLGSSMCRSRNAAASGVTKAPNPKKKHAMFMA